MGHNSLVPIYREATQEPYSYLVVDNTNDCPKHLRIRSNIFPGEVTRVYVPSEIEEQIEQEEPVE